MAKSKKRKANKQDTRKSQNLDKKITKKIISEVKNGVFIFSEPLTVEQLAAKLGVQSSEIIKLFFMKGVVHNPNSTLSEESIAEVCLHFELDFKKEEVITKQNILEMKNDDGPSKNSVSRPPIVTIMGHVDHGKTTLLDVIRKTNVVKHEHGGITQHLGAYQVRKNNQLISFIDTPGHEAFTEMRSRGANVTDIVVLVVDATDGMMPQTEEAIDHAKAAGVEIIVFINKMDKEGANPDKVSSQLAEKKLISEEWGGNTIYIRGSAKKNEGINELLEAILTIAELAELKTNHQQWARGIVLEAHLNKGMGAVATLIVKSGTLKTGDSIVLGSTYGKIRSMLDYNNKRLKEASASMPVLVSGLNSVPQAGDNFLAFEDEKLAKNTAKEREIKQIANESNASKLAIEDDQKNLNVIIKTDVQGTAEAIKKVLGKIVVENASINIIRIAVGQIGESDIILASASKAVVIGFNTRPNAKVYEIAKNHNVVIRLHSVIYKLNEDLEAMVKGILDPVYKDEILGQAEIREIYHSSKAGNIAGCAVISGVIRRNSRVRVLRDGVPVYDGELSSLKRFKDDVREVMKGFECGLIVRNFGDVKTADIVEAYEKKEIQR